MRLIVVCRKLVLLRIKQSFHTESCIQKCPCSSGTKSNRLKVSAVVGYTKRRRNDGTDDGTARSVIRPMGGRCAGLVTAGAVLSSVPSYSQRTKTSSL